MQAQIVKIDFKQQEATRDLAEELMMLFSEAKLAASSYVIETNHKTGELIVNHPAYKKGAHGTGELIKQLAAGCGKSEQHLYFCIKFYQEYPKVSNALETLQPDEKKLTWRQIVQVISGSEEQSACMHQETIIIKYCACKKCGTRIRD